MAIAYQPAMTPDPVSARPALRRSPHELLPVDLQPRPWTALRLAGLLVATALCVALAAAFVTGTALFALLNFAG